MRLRRSISFQVLKALAMSWTSRTLRRSSASRHILLTSARVAVKKSLRNGCRLGWRPNTHGWFQMLAELTYRLISRCRYPLTRYGDRPPMLHARVFSARPSHERRAFPDTARPSRGAFYLTPALCCSEVEDDDDEEDLVDSEEEEEFTRGTAARCVSDTTK